MFDYSSETFKAWLAAWIDTEGCICIKGKTKRKNRKHGERTGSHRGHKLTMDIVQTDPRPLLVIQKCYGGSLFKRKRSIHRKTTYALMTSNRVSLQILQDTMPYLIVKKSQAEIALEFYKLVDKGKRGKQKRSRHNPITDNELIQREAYRQKIMQLNQGYSSDKIPRYINAN